MSHGVVLHLPRPAVADHHVSPRRRTCSVKLVGAGQAPNSTLAAWDGLIAHNHHSLQIKYPDPKRIRGLARAVAVPCLLREHNWEAKSVSTPCRLFHVALTR